jgi:hypothetical protein
LQLVTQSDAKKNNAQESAPSNNLAQSSEKDTRQTHPAKKRNANNLVGQSRSGVTDRHSVCRYFVIFRAPVSNKLS